jgi:L-ascorbate metabolism protein UlaG (beta-lactamase superfamily)
MDLTGFYKRSKSLRRLGIGAFACILMLASCAKKVSGFYPEIIPSRTTATLPVKPNGKSKVSLTYLGAGNMIIEKDGEAIVTDPFFSNQKFLKMIGKVQTRDDMFDLWKSRVQAQTSKSYVRAALVSHTHYDHVMDLPTLLQSNYFSKMERVYGNNYLPQMMVNFQKDGTSVEGLSNEQIFQPTISNDNAYEWIQVSPKIRFLAIESNHAPHTKRKLYQSKPLDPEYFKDNLIWPNSKLKTRKWTVGTTYAFLVDFIQGDTLRMYIQTSASQYPYGAPPKEEFKKKKVDVAVICYASTNNVKDYPKAIVKDIDPAKMVIVHWEDFFRDSRTDDDVMLVRKTNPKKARKRFDELGKKKDFFVMPRPGTKVDITY